MRLVKKFFVLFLAFLLVTSTIPIPAAAADSNSDTGSSLTKAEYLLDEDFGFMSPTGGSDNIVVSGWDVKAAGGNLSYQYYSWFKISDTSKVLPVSLNKKFNTQSIGKITLEYRFKPMTAIDGLKWQLRSGSTIGMSVYTSGANLYMDTSGSNPVLLQPYAASTEYGVKVIADITQNKADVYINGVLKASNVAFKNSVSSLDNFNMSTGETSTGDIYIPTVKIYKGYTVNEKFITTMDNLPRDWASSASGGSIVVEKADNASPPDTYSLKMDATNSTEPMTFRKNISAQSGALVFEYKVLFPEKVDGMSAELLNGDTGIIKLVTANGQLCYVNVVGQAVPVYDYVANMWYSIKIKLDTASSKADIYINGKLKKQGANFAANGTGIDGIKYSTSTENKGKMYLDDIQLYNDTPLPSDYVPAPQKVSSKDILVGTQSCSMWREGHHLGWDRINPYPDRTPILGYYDEGNPETADWEIKWMAEHGINFQMFCWYRDRGSVSEGKPIKEPDLSAALSGYMNAKYSDQVDFTIMWENGSSKAKDSADFRNNIVPYWIEYYLKDSRYLVVDNKPVIAIYSLNRLKSFFGGTVEGVKAEMDYLRSEVKKLGFEDATLLISHSGADPVIMSECKAAGFDAIFSYSWGALSGNPDVQQTKLQQQSDAGTIDMVPIISMGRDDSAWDRGSGYYSTTDEFQSVAQWVKDTFVPSLPDTSPGKKMVLLDNWNEYGEGHFIIPAALNGFGYLDAIRNVFTDGGAHEDAVPTQAQKDRVCVLYPKDRVLPAKTVTKPEITSIYSKQWNFNVDGDSEGWGATTDDIKDINNISVLNGVLSATATGNDPWIISPYNLGFSADENPYIHIRMKNGTNDAFGRIYFITEADQTWNEAKAVSFVVERNDSGYTDYYADMWKNSKWTGKVKAFRLDPAMATGNFSIDFIGVVYSPMQDIKTYFDGQHTKLPNQAKIIDGCTMVPIEDVYSKLSIPKQWNDNPEELIAVKGESIYKLIPGQITAYKDSTAITIEHAPVFSDGAFYAPVSFLKQAFGYIVSWNEQDKEIAICTSSIPVKGDNLVIDPGMELGSNTQMTNASIAREYSTAQAHSGNQSVKITKQGTYGSIYFRTSQQVKGQEYYYSTWLKLDADSVSLKNSTPQYPVARVCIQYKLDGVTKQYIMFTSAKLSTTQWQQVQGTYTVNETGTVTDMCMFIFTDLPAAYDTFYLDDVEIRPVTYTTSHAWVYVSDISLNKTAATIGLGNVQLLTASVQPANAVNKAVEWSSDNTDVAIVDQNGYVYGKSEGTANITATTIDGGKTATCYVTVKEGAYEVVTLTVKPDGTGDFLSPKIANDSIIDSSAGKQYVILVYPGIYTEKNWIVKPYTTIRGTDRDNCWLKGENSESATNSEITGQSTIWLKPTANLENLKITCKNMRYPVHSEDNGNNKNAVHNITNCYVEHYGNLEAVQYRQKWIAAHPGVTPSVDLDPAQVWGGASGVGSHAWGFGAASGEVENFYDSTFVSKSDGWYVHNREDFTLPQISTINNSKIVSTVTSVPITIQSLGSGTKDQVIFNNCEITGTYIYQNDWPWISQKPENQYASHADYTVTLNGCTPIGYMDGHRGRALAIFSNSTGSTSNIRVSGNAVNDILGQYTTKDGGGTLKGYVYGYWDISGIKVGLNSNIVVNNTLGRRLGNCTSANKTLIIAFEDGTTKSIVFNEDYTNQSNSYIIGKINSVLGSAGYAAEYNLTANEYYPQVIDKQMTMTNNTNVGIPRFSAVCYDSDTKSIRLMKSTDSKDMFLGITLEGIAPGQSGRVLTEGIMHKTQLSGLSGSIGVGTQISISSKDGCFAVNSTNAAVMEGIRTDWAYFKGNITGAFNSLSITADKTVIKTEDTASLTLTGTMSDGTAADMSKAQIVYTSDNEQVATVDQSGTVTAVGEGTAKIKAAAQIDGITKEVEIQIMVDVTPAVTTYGISGTSVNEWYTGDVTITMTSSDSLSGVEKTEYRLSENSDWITYTAPVAITADGNYTVQYRSTDKAGNVEEPKQVTVKIDKTAPVTTTAAIGIIRSDGTYNSHVTLTLSSEDAASGSADVSGVAGIEYSLDGANWLAYTAPLELNDNGTYSISYRATDNAGNVEAAKNVSILISMNPDVMVSYLKEKVNTMSIEEGIKSSLTAKLDNALSSILDGNKNSSANQLNAFINQVNAQSGKKLTDEQAEVLKAEANKIIPGINEAAVFGIPGKAVLAMLIPSGLLKGPTVRICGDK